jgi:hypothetical protein
VHTDPVVVSKLARITVPPSATHVFCRDDRDTDGWLSIPGPDHAVWGRFDIPAADLPLVLAAMPKDARQESSISTHKLSESWWQPEQLLNPKSVSWSTPGFAFHLDYGDGEGGLVRIYFFNHSL